VPERFLRKPSRAAGIEVKRFLDDNQELADHLEQKNSHHHPNSPAGKAENMFFESLEDFITYLVRFDVPPRFYKRYIDNFIKSASQEQEVCVKPPKNICDSQQKNNNTQNLGSSHGDMQIKEEMPSNQVWLLGNGDHHSNGVLTALDNKGADATVSDTINSRPQNLLTDISHNSSVLPPPSDSNTHFQRSNHIPQNLDLNGKHTPTSPSETGSETRKSTPKSPERPTTLDLAALKDTEHVTSSSTATPPRVPLKMLHLSPDEHLV
jgi:hypothetical protein